MTVYGRLQVRPVAPPFGDVLRSLRRTAGVSLAALSARTHYSKSMIGHVETGARAATGEFAAACDRALGTGPLLSIVLGTQERGDDVRRRALLAHIGTAAGLLAVAGPGALGDLVRQGLLDAAGHGQDWDAVLDHYGRRLVADPSADLGASLLAQLVAVRQGVAENSGDRDLLRAGAGLGQVYGLWLGNQGDISGAHNWYRTATTLADRSGDRMMQEFVRGRSASRGIMEDWTIRETLAVAEETLTRNRAPTVGALEAYGARLNVYALTGDLAEGRKAAAGMRAVVDGLPDSVLRTRPHPAERVAHFSGYLECRAGTRRDADAAFATVERALGGVPYWLVDAQVYYGRAMVADGDVRGGVTYVLDAVRGCGYDAVYVLGVGVRDVLSVVPAGHRSEELDELATYAAAGPVPWEKTA
jgi:transcriptional regulator with XRE-family HTH domain